MTEAMLRFLCEQLREWGGLSETEIRRIYDTERKKLSEKFTNLCQTPTFDP
jgi:hypothetical protein